MRLRFDIAAPGKPLTTLEREGLLVHIGRDPTCELAFEPGYDGVSWRHVRIEDTQAGPLLHDLGSTNGTYVNSTRVTGPTLLKSGDVVRLGQRGPQLRLALPEPSRSEQTSVEPYPIREPAAPPHAPVAVAVPPSSVRLSRPPGPMQPSSDPRPTLAGALSPLRTDQRRKLATKRFRWLMMLVAAFAGMLVVIVGAAALLYFLN